MNSSHSNDTVKIYLTSSKDKNKSYNLNFSHLDCGEIYYFSIKFENRDELFFERSFTGEDNFEDKGFYFVSGFKISNKNFKRYKHKKISELKFFTNTYCKSSQESYFQIWTFELKDFKLDQLKFKKTEL